MRERIDRARTLFSAILAEIRAENLTFMAGSIAYHAFVSLLPLLLLLLAVAAAVGNQSIEDAIIGVADAMLQRGVGEALVQELQSSGRSTGVSLLGLGVLLWGTLRIFRGLDTAFSDIYETESANTMVDQLWDGFVVLAAVGLAIVVGGFIQDLLSTGIPRVDWVLGTIAAVLGLSLAFFPMYYIFPDTDVTVREVIPGTVFAAVGLTTFESLFGLYLQYGSRTTDGNVVAGVIVLLTWLYFSGLVILLGVVVNAVLANRSRDIDVVPVFGDVTTDGPVGLPREELVASVEELERLLTGSEDLTLTGDGEEASVPSPTHVIPDTEAPLLLERGRPVRLELQWTPAEEPGQRAGSAVDAGGAETTTDEGRPAEEAKDEEEEADPATRPED